MVTSAQTNSSTFLPGLQEFSQAPDLVDILALKADREQYFRKFHENCDHARDWFFGRVSSPAPEGFDEVTTAKARASL